MEKIRIVTAPKDVNTDSSLVNKKVLKISEKLQHNFTINQSTIDPVMLT